MIIYIVSIQSTMHFSLKHLLCTGLLALSVGFAISVVSCKGKSKKEGAVLPDDFLKFYDQFHVDSAYQMDHIVFPLSGKPEMIEKDTLSFEWQKNKWPLHHAFDSGNREFERVVKKIDENLVEEIIQHRTTGFGMKRRFAKLGEEWNLIYYAGMNSSEFIE